METKEMWPRSVFDKTQHNITHQHRIFVLEQGSRRNVMANVAVVFELNSSINWAILYIVMK